MKEVELSPVAHLQYGWWFAHWMQTSRRERAAIALAGAGPDLDGLAMFGGGDAYYRYHHMLFHNLGSTLAVIPLAGIFFWKRPVVWFLVVFAFGMHVVEDYFTVAWPMRVWEPFNDSVTNLGNHFPIWMVQGVFQIAAILFILSMTVWIYLRYHRTPLEIISPDFDRLIMGYAVLPWHHRCGECKARAHFRCERCGRMLCAEHGVVRRGFKVVCKKCPESPPGDLFPASGVTT
ncbi:MAG TPA: metal-dependent hydrolase [Terriglobia bacterium]|nr:metal-dependent hydrolase [Terriglobia bacterium]